MLFRSWIFCPRESVSCCPCESVPTPTFAHVRCVACGLVHVCKVWGCPSLTCCPSVSWLPLCFQKAAQGSSALHSHTLPPNTNKEGGAFLHNLNFECARHEVWSMWSLDLTSLISWILKFEIWIWILDIWISKYFPCLAFHLWQLVTWFLE